MNMMAIKRNYYFCKLHMFGPRKVDYLFCVSALIPKILMHLADLSIFYIFSLFNLFQIFFKVKLQTSKDCKNVSYQCVPSVFETKPSLD